MRPGPPLPLVVWLLIAPVGAGAVESTPESIADRAVARCRLHYGILGPYLVKSCIERDLGAYRALLGYPDDALPVLNECAQRERDRGWSVVKSCVDAYLEARRR